MKRNKKGKSTPDYYKLDPSYLQGKRIKRRLRLINELLFIHKRNHDQQYKLMEKLIAEKKVLKELIEVKKKENENEKVD